MEKMVIKIDVGMVDESHIGELRKLVNDLPLNHWEIEAVRKGEHTNVYYFENFEERYSEEEFLRHIGKEGAETEFHLIIGDIQNLIEKIPAWA